MFTGIIEEIGIIKMVQQGAKSATLSVSANRILQDVKIGDSISVNGICLTVISFQGSVFMVDVMPETLRRTNLNDLSAGSKVNLERALKLSDRLGGHMVSGHIDGIGKVIRRREEDNAIWFSIGTDISLLRYIVEKGSVALDGISLTVASVNSRTFEVSVIPHTRQVTTILERKAGDHVNIECDMVAKYVEKLSQPVQGDSKIDMNFLEKNDFLY